MLTPYTRLIRFIMDGEPVTAAVANRPSQDLASRTQNLKEILDALAASQMIEIPDAILQPGMTVGTPVYLDGATNTYRPAISATRSQENGNPALPQSFFAGILIAQEAGTNGVIGVTGRFTGLTLAQWAAHIETRDLVGGLAVPGHYYLSSTQAGFLTLTPSGLGVYVGQLSASGAMDVRASNPDYASHTHHEFMLSPLPAVANVVTDVTETLGVWSITTPNAAYRGWLPATTQPAVNVPPGVTAASSFWYNLDHPTDAPLRSLFPPVPVDSFVVVRGTEIQPIGRIVVNEFGIWWTQNRNDATNAAPWSENVQVDPANEENIQFWFSRIMLATDGGIVRSLSVSPSSELDAAFLDLGGNLATDGTLQLSIKSLKEALPVPDPAIPASALAVKAIAGKQFVRGSVIARIKGAPGIVVTGTQGNAAEGFYGDVTLALSNTILTQGNANIADLNNARIESISGLQGVTLVAQRTAAPTWTLFIPPGLATTTLNLKFWVFVSSDAALPTGVPIQLDYKVVPPALVPSVIPGWTNLMAFTDANTDLGPAPRLGKYEVTKALTIPGVPGGSTVIIRLSRNAADGYSGNLTVLRVEYELV